jgi:hypothetical protein
VGGVTVLNEGPCQVGEAVVGHEATGGVWIPGIVNQQPIIQ